MNRNGPPPAPVPPAGDLQEVRRRLKSLGYLKSPVDRFLFGSIGSPVPRWRALLSASLRVGSISGPLMGILLLLVLVVHNHPHLYRPRDLAILYLYSSVTSGLLLSLGFLVLSWILVGRRHGPAFRIASPLPWSEVAGFTLAGGLGVYLGWRWLREGAGGIPAGSTTARFFILAAILGTGIWLGSVLTRALLGSLLVARPAVGVPGVRRRFGRRALWIFLPVSAVLLALGMWADRAQERRPSAAPSYSIGPGDRGRLLLVGLDGFEARAAALLGPAAAPVIALEAVADREPPAIWTTLMTGRRSQDHGIRSIQSLSLMGVRTPLREALFLQPLQDALNLLLPGFRPVARRPVNSRLRRAKTVWEILADRQRPVVVINWWATWPAVPIGNGVLVTERAYFKLLAGGPREGETDPPELMDALASSFEADMKAARGAAGALLDTLTPPAGTREIVGRALTRDAYHIALAVRFLEERPDADLFLYLPGLDVVQTALMDRPGPATPAGTWNAGVILEAYHRFLDRACRDLWEGPPPLPDLILLVGDPGRSYRRDGASERQGRGVLKWIARGRRVFRLPVDRPTGLDVAPTVLALKGFPRSREMPGTPLLAPEGESQEVIATFGPPPAGEENGADHSPFDGEMLEQLRSLGYLR